LRTITTGTETAIGAQFSGDPTPRPLKCRTFHVRSPPRHNSAFDIRDLGFILVAFHRSNVPVCEGADQCSRGGCAPARLSSGASDCAKPLFTPDNTQLSPSRPWPRR
jgi:hypothetical protein